jgi:prevent-host-death family protein
MTTMSAREFNQDVSAAKRAAASAPVIITDRGKPSFVLLSFEEYRRLTGQERNVVDWLAMSDDIDLQVEQVRVELGVPEL